MANIQEKCVEGDKKKLHDTRSYHRTKMQKEIILEKLKEKGCRITKQRILIIDIILENECGCCKEIYYKLCIMDRSIGIATVYRLINTLEEIGAISRKNMYKVSYSENCIMKNACTVILEDNTTYHLSGQKWHEIIKVGLTSCGYLQNQNIASITLNSCECENKEC
ncbi:MAG: transcriptional repressor [Lachnotalea sp.]